MKIRLYILAPNGNDFSEAQMSALKTKYNEILHVDKIMPFGELPNITDDFEKVFAIDPDFCDWNIPNSALDTPGLSAVCLNTTSYSWIDLEYATAEGIAVTNIRHYSTDSVAESGLAMAFNIARKLPLYIKNKMEIDFETMRGTELHGKTAGIIGLGDIGRRLAELCYGIGMNVIYWSHRSEDNRFEKTELATLFKNADVIFPAMLKNSETEKIITDSVLESMRQNAIFIEVTENFLYNHQLLLDLTKQGRIYGYGFEELHPKTYDGNVLALPPVSYYTKEAIDRNVSQWADCILNLKNKLN